MGSVNLGENEIPRGNGFRYLDSTVQADGGLDLGGGKEDSSWME